MNAAVHQVVASWVQAVGSVVAIVAAFIIARMEYQRSKSELKEARDREASALQREVNRQADERRALGGSLTARLTLALNTIGAARLRMSQAHPKNQIMFAKISSRELGEVSDLLSQLSPTALGDVDSTALLTEGITHVMYARATVDTVTELLVNSTGTVSGSQLITNMTSLLSKTEADLRVIRDAMLDLTYQG